MLNSMGLGQEIIPWLSSKKISTGFPRAICACAGGSFVGGEIFKIDHVFERSLRGLGL